MKRLILLSTTFLLGNLMTQPNYYLAQGTSPVQNQESIDLVQPIQNELDLALEQFYEHFPKADINEISIHHHQENLDYVFKIEGITNTKELKMKIYQGAVYVDFEADDGDDDVNDIIDLSNMYSVDYLTQKAMDYTGLSILLDWELDYNNDYHETVWEIELTDGYNKVDVKLGAVTGNLLEVDYEDNDMDDEDYYTMFYSQQVSQTEISETPLILETSQSSNKLSYDQAIAIATNYFGLSPHDVKLDEVELDEDDGYYYYEINFYYGEFEYEVEVEAYSGTILSAEKDD